MTRRDRQALTLDEIQYLTGHATTDAIRMALRRAGFTAAGIAVGFGPGGWPPRKSYAVEDVWATFAQRIVHHAGTDAQVKERVWKIFRDEITDATMAPKIGDVFADKLG